MTLFVFSLLHGLHLYSAFIQSALQFMPLIHPFTHQRQLAAMQGTNQLIRSNWGLGVLLRDTSTRPGWDWTGNPPTARRLLLPPELYHPLLYSPLWIRQSRLSVASPAPNEKAPHRSARTPPMHRSAVAIFYGRPEGTLMAGHGLWAPVVSPGKK